MWVFASFVGLIRLCNSGVLAPYLPFRAKSVAGSDTAPPMQPRPRPSLPQPLERARGLTPELLRARFHYLAAQNGDGTFSLPVSEMETLLIGRAVRVCNREPRAIARYMQTHQNLSRGR